MTGNQPTMQHTLYPPMALPFTARNQDVTQPSRGQMWHPGVSYTQPAPAIKGIKQEVTSFQYSESQPPMALPSTERNENGTRLPQGQKLHPGMNYTQPAPTGQNVVQQTSTAQPATFPLYNVASTSTPSTYITEENFGQLEKKPQMSVNNFVPEMSEPSAKRIKQESTSSYKPDGINVGNAAVTVMSEYKLHVKSVAWFTFIIYTLPLHLTRRDDIEIEVAGKTVDQEIRVRFLAYPHCVFALQ